MRLRAGGLGMKLDEIQRRLLQGLVELEPAERLPELIAQGWVRGFAS
jgi:hypothetical protein